MKKKLFLFISISIVSSGLLLSLGYWQLKSKLPTLLKMVLAEAHTKGINVSFQQVIPPQDSLLDLTQVKISGQNSTYSVTVDSLKIKTSLKPKWPPIALSILLNHPTILTNTNLPNIESPPLERKPDETRKNPRWLAAALLMAHFKLELIDIEALPWGIKKTDFSISTNGISLGKGPLPLLQAEHRLHIKDFSSSKLPTLPNILITGAVNYEHPAAHFLTTKVSIGPVTLQASGKYDISSTKWNLDVEIPQSNIKQVDLLKQNSSIKGLKSAEGTIYLKASSQGLGSEINSIYTEGELRAEKVKLFMESPKITGPISIDINSTFKKTAALIFNGSLDLNLDDSSLLIENKFRKPAKIPLNAHLKISGNNEEYRIEEGNIKFHNLKTDIQGIVLNGPKITTRLQASIGTTSLQGWEQFIPSLLNIKTQGDIEGNLTYSGAINDWKSASVELNIKAKDVEVPMAKEWISNKEVSLSGTAKLNSDTQISYSQGALKTLNTNTQLNLTESKFGYSDLFVKPNGTPMSAHLIISSTTKEAQVKNSTLVLGPIRGTIQGKIANFSAPVAQLKLQTSPLEAKEALFLSPILKATQIKIIRGTLTSKASLTGPLLSKEKLPNINIETQINRLSLDYPQESSVKPLHIRDMQGLLSSTLASGGLTQLKLEPLSLKVFNGTLLMKLDCKGDIKTARCDQKVDVTQLAADQFLEFMSPKAKGLVSGKLTADIDGQFTGLSLETLKKSITGKGTFLLSEGQFNTINLIEKPLESLKKLPIIANLINQAPRNQAIKETHGHFELKDGKIIFSNLKMNSPYFDLISPMATLDMDQKIYSKISWIPKEILISRNVLEMIRDEKGKPSISVIIQGNISQPSISLDENALQYRLTNYAKQIAEEKANRAISNLKKKYGNEMQERLKKSFGGIFKK